MRVIFFIILSLLFFYPSVVMAAVNTEKNIIFNFKEKEELVYNRGDRILTSLNIESDSMINAVSGSLKIEGPASFENLITSDSVVSYWLDGPVVSEDKKEVTFSGVIIGGYSGNTGSIFDLVIRSQSEGDVYLKTSGVDVFLHDGRGTKLSVNESAKKIRINPGDSRVLRPPVDDNTPPDLFAPYVFSDPVLTNGSWIMFFSTGDRGSGVMEYRIFIDGRDYGKIKSPLVIEDAWFGRKIVIRAVDNMGNFRDVVFDLDKSNSDTYDMFFIGLVVFGIVLNIIWIHFINLNNK